MNVRFLHQSARTTCRKAKAYLGNLGADLGLCNLDTERLSKSELDPLIGDRPPSRAEAIQLMANAPNLIRRPVVISGKQVMLG